MGSLQKRETFALSNLEHFPVDTLSLQNLKEQAHKAEIQRMKKGLLAVFPAIGASMFAYLVWCAAWLQFVLLPFAMFVISSGGMVQGSWITFLVLSFVGFVTLPALGLITAGAGLEKRFRLWGSKPFNSDGELAETLLNGIYTSQYVLKSSSNQTQIKISLQKQTAVGPENVRIQNLLNKKRHSDKKGFVKPQKYGTRIEDDLLLSGINAFEIDPESEQEAWNEYHEQQPTFKEETIEEIILDCNTPEANCIVQEKVEEMKQRCEELNQAERRLVLEKVEKRAIHTQVHNAIEKNKNL